MNLKITILLLIAILLLGCAQQTPKKSGLEAGEKTWPQKNFQEQTQTADVKTTEPKAEGMSMQKVSFQTSDGVTIVANYFKPSGKAKAKVVLLHMRPKAKESWDNFAKKLQAAGLEVLAIDMRGWGESTQGANGKVLSYSNFTPQEYNGIVKDVEAAAKFLDAKPSEIYLAGASIGSNISFNYGTQNNSAKVVLLSPGLNYLGVSIEDAKDAFQNFKGKMLIVASKEDLYSYQSVQKLEGYASGLGNIEFLKVENSGHGTDMFGNAEVEKRAFNFLTN